MKPIVAKLRIIHRNCFTDLSRRYGIKLLVYPNLGEKGTFGLIEIPSSTYLDEETADFIERIVRIGEDGTFYFYKSHPHHQSILEEVLRNGCLPIIPVVVENGCEYWSIINIEDGLKKLYEALCERSIEVEVISVREGDETEIKYGFYVNLSERQKEILNHAFSLGYYEWPRKITLEKLSKEMGISRTSLMYHLRRAEREIIGIFLEKLL